jgi:hypothetical protein
MGWIHAAMLVLTPTVQMIAPYIPAIPGRYRFSLNGNARECGRYMFAEEPFLVDEAGHLWVWVDPQWSRLNTWLVSGDA